MRQNFLPRAQGLLSVLVRALRAGLSEERRMRQRRVAAAVGSGQRAEG